MEAWIRLGEVGQPLPNILLVNPARSLNDAISMIGIHRPDLQMRAQRMLSAKPRWIGHDKK
jgi:hypothetical protein